MNVIEEAAELDRTVPAVELANDLAARDVERGELRTLVEVAGACSASGGVTLAVR